MDDTAPMLLAKRRMRAAQQAARERLDPGVGAALVTHLSPLFRPGLVVAGFWPMGAEIDLRPVLGAARVARCAVVLPVTPTRGQRLVFRRLAGADALLPGPFGTSEPDPGQPVLEPALLLVPLLAFDRLGGRLGYGGGFYDRTLRSLRDADPGVRAIGCAYAAQEVPSVPMEPFDERLDGVATERGLVWFERGAGGR